ncbi:EAL domain-containing protein [Celerinatantimonas sp. YJH-8]|uniref:EAL domain-containing protein n=1 Tax=Celerinatantimonas sp. YJH-8 TaxID=3228714 RepID=UPI0038C0C7E6
MHYLQTLRWKLFPWLAGIVLAFIFLVILFLTQHIYNEQIQQTSFNEQVERLYETLNHQIHTTIEHVEKSPAISPQCDPQDIYTLRQLQFDNSHIALFGLISPQGTVLCTSWGAPKAVHHVKQLQLTENKMRLIGPIALNYLERPSFILGWGLPNHYALYGWLPIHHLSNIFSQMDQNIHVEIIHSDTLNTMLQSNFPESAAAKKMRPIYTPIQKREQHERQVEGHHLYYFRAPFKDLPHIALYASYDLKHSILPVNFEPLWYMMAFAIFISATLTILQLRKTLEDSRWTLKHALNNHQLVNYFQPVFNTHTQQVEGVEVLVRWQHPRQGLLTPQHFLANLIRYRLCDQFLLQQLKQLPEQLAPIKQINPALKVNINVLAHQLMNPLVIQGIHQLQQQIGSVIIELTEQELVSDQPLFLDVLEQLREDRIKIAIDDFGTGFSSLSYLQKFPVDLLKIDQMFVASIGTDAVNTPVLESIIHLGHRLHIQMVAEGVETFEQSEKLNRMGIVFQQGWLHGKPIPASQLLSLKVFSKTPD